ncbi:MAG: ABC transporter permease [Ferruginibacter sp.]
MLNLFRVEWLKIRTYKTFWILFGTFCVMFPIAFYFSASKYMENKNGIQEETIKAFLGSPFIFPKVWHSASWFGGMFFVMMGMLFILLITNEVQYRTHRQNIIDGWSRLDFLKAKFSLLIFFVLVSTLLVFISALAVGYIFSKNTSSPFENMYYLWYFMLMATIYLMVAYLVAILVKRTGLSVIIYFAVVCIIDNLLWLILTLYNNQFGYFLPLEAGDSLIVNPFKPAIMEKRTVSDMALIATGLGYIVLFAFIIIRYFKRSDLKT